MLEPESGGHRIQRVPPTEKRGRVHTSTVTVVVLNSAQATAVETTLDAKDVRTEWFSGTGKGGQHRNKTQNCCRLIHNETGLTVTAQGRSRKSNYDQAFAEMQDRLNELNKNAHKSNLKNVRQELAGTAMRADKIRTYRFQDDTVKDHNSGKSMKASKVMKGEFDKLH